MKYRITLTQEQAALVSEALDVYASLRTGQFRAALELLPTSKVFPRGWHETIDAVGRLLSEHTIEHVDGWRSSLGITHEKVQESGKIAWDMHQAIRHRMSWDYAVERGYVAGIDSPRNWKEMMGVSYDEPLVISRLPLPKIETCED